MEGLVLKSVPFEDQNRILSIFTNDAGIISVMIKRLGKKNLALHNISSVLSLSEFQVHKSRGNFYRFSDATLIDGFAEIRNDLDKLTAAGQMLKVIIETQYPEKSTPNLYLLLKHFLKRMKSTHKTANLLSSFYLKLLKHEGHLPAEKCDFNTSFGEDEWETMQVLTHARSFDVLESIEVSPQVEKRVKTLLSHTGVF